MFQENNYPEYYSKKFNGAVNNVLVLKTELELIPLRNTSNFNLYHSLCEEMWELR